MKKAKYIIKLVLFLICAIFPFMHNVINHSIAQLIWYPSLATWIGLSIFCCIRHKCPKFEETIFNCIAKYGFFVLLGILGSAFVFNYYEIDYIWLWVIFVIVAVCMPLFFYSLLKVYIEENGLTKSEQQKAGLNIIKYILLYWFIDIVYAGIFNDWQNLVYVFGILSILIIFFNVVNAFLNGSRNLHFMICIDLLLGLGLTSYVLYIIPDKTIQSIILTITAAIFGGMFTLVGVAWTIKQTHEDDYIKDIKRNKPYLCKATGNIDYPIKINIEGSYNLGIHVLSDSIFIFKGLYLDDKYEARYRVIPPKSNFLITINLDNYNEISIIGADIFGNNYRFDLDCSIKLSTKTIYVDSIGLPIETEDDEII